MVIRCSLNLFYLTHSNLPVDDASYYECYTLFRGPSMRQKELEEKKKTKEFKRKWLR